MSKTLKAMVVDDLRGRIGTCQNFVVVDSSKLDARSLNRVRNELRKEEIHLLGVKNTLAIKALQTAGLTGDLSLSFKGPSVMVYGGKDIVQLTKAVQKRVKDFKDKVVVKGGVVDGQTVNASDVETISKGPNREEMIAKLVGQILGPGATLGAMLLGPGATVAGQIKQISEKEEKADEGVPEAT